MDTQQAIENYRQLASKVDAKFAEIQARASSAFHCQKGCHSCCQPGLTVSPVEREAIRQHILQTPGLQERLLELEARDPHQGTRCRLLDEKGLCLIYEVRPLICRSHGAPIVFRSEADEEGESEQNHDVCPLNFQETSLTELPDSMFLNIDTVNAILAVINQAWLREPKASSQRSELQVTALIGGAD